jgi:hypothetical protein
MSHGYFNLHHLIAKGYFKAISDFRPWEECTVRDGANLKKNTYSQTGLWFIFNLRIEKNGVRYIHILIGVMIITYQHKFRFYTHRIFIYIWAAKHCLHRSSLKADWVFSFTMWVRMPNNIPLMAWLGYFKLGLPRSCCWLPSQLKHL